MRQNSTPQQVPNGNNNPSLQKSAPPYASSPSPQPINPGKALPSNNRASEANAVQQPSTQAQNVDLSKGWSNNYDIEFIFIPPTGFISDPDLKLCDGANCIHMNTSYKVIIPKGTFKALPYQGDEHHNADGSVKGPATDGKGLTYMPFPPPKPALTLTVLCGVPQTQGSLVLSNPNVKKIVFSPSPKEFIPYLQQEKGAMIDSVTERLVNSDGTSSMAPDLSNPNPINTFSNVHLVY